MPLNLKKKCFYKNLKVSFSSTATYYDILINVISSRKVILFSSALFTLHYNRCSIMRFFSPTINYSYRKIAVVFPPPRSKKQHNETNTERKGFPPAKVSQVCIADFRIVILSIGERITEKTPSRSLAENTNIWTCHTLSLQAARPETLCLTSTMNDLSRSACS